MNSRTTASRSSATNAGVQALLQSLPGPSGPPGPQGSHTGRRGYSSGTRQFGLFASQTSRRCWAYSCPAPPQNNCSLTFSTTSRGGGDGCCARAAGGVVASARLRGGCGVLIRLRVAAAVVQPQIRVGVLEFLRSNNSPHPWAPAPARSSNACRHRASTSGTPLRRLRRSESRSAALRRRRFRRHPGCGYCQNPPRQCHQRQVKAREPGIAGVVGGAGFPGRSVRPRLMARTAVLAHHVPSSCWS